MKKTEDVLIKNKLIQPMTQETITKKYLLASTGGSGAGYLLRYFYHLLSVKAETHWVASENFFHVLEQEFELNWREIKAQDVGPKTAQLFSENKTENKTQKIVHKFKTYDYKNIKATAASGSSNYEAMIVLPCSMKTLGSIANGIAENLIERAADVTLKERRKLILVIRESPYSLIHIENMKKVHLAGGLILPASPGFYHHPKSINDIYDFIVDRVFRHIGIDKPLVSYEGKE